MEKPKPRFKLSLLNIILLVIAMSLGFMVQRGVHDGSAYSMGRMVGALTAPIVISLLLGWIAFRASKRRHSVGAIAMNVWLGLSIVGSLVQMSGGPANPNDVDGKSLSSTTNTLKRDLRRADTPEERAEIAVAGMRELAAEATRLSRDAPKSQRATHAAFASSLNRGIQTLRDWNISQDHFVNANIFDVYTLAANETAEEYERRRDACRAIRAAVKQYHRGVISNWEQSVAELRAIPGRDDFTRGMIDGLNDANSGQRPILDRLLHSQTAYADTAIEMLDLMEANEWELADDELIIDDDVVSAEYNRIIDALTRIEEEFGAINEGLTENLGK